MESSSRQRVQPVHPCAVEPAGQESQPWRWDSMVNSFKRKVSTLNARSINHNLRVRSATPFLLLMYVVGTFSVAWLVWIPLVLAEHGLMAVPIAPTLLLFAGTYAPTITAIGLTVWRWRGRGLRTLFGQALRWRVGYWWYVIAIVGPALVMGGAVGMHLLLGGTAPQFPALQRWPLVLINFVAVLLLGGPLGEEFGWRGFALPLLQQRLSVGWASLVLGSVWGVWHLPLFFTRMTLQHTLPVELFLAQTVGLTIIFTWFYNSTGGSLLIILLAHTAVNTLAQPLGIVPAATGSLRPYVLSTLLVWVGALAVLYRAQPAHRTWGMTPHAGTRHLNTGISDVQGGG